MMYSNHIVPDTDFIMENIDLETFQMPTESMRGMCAKFIQEPHQHQQQSLVEMDFDAGLDLAVFGLGRLMSTDPKDEEALENLEIPLVGEEDQLDHRVPRQISHPMGRNGDGTIIDAMDGALAFNPFGANVSDTMSDKVSSSVVSDTFAREDRAEEPSKVTSAATSPSTSRNGTLNRAPNSPKSQSGDVCGRRWSDYVLDMKTKQLNRYLKNAALTEVEMNDLKKERRRKLNRKYAKTSRIKKKGCSFGHNAHLTVPQCEDDSEYNSDAISEGAYDSDLYTAHNAAQRVPGSPFQNMRFGSYGTL
jgi:hypothetical protein